MSLWAGPMRRAVGGRGRDGRGVGTVVRSLVKLFCQERLRTQGFRKPDYAFFSSFLKKSLFKINLSL